MLIHHRIANIINRTARRGLLGFQFCASLFSQLNAAIWSREVPEVRKVRDSGKVIDAPLVDGVNFFCPASRPTCSDAISQRDPGISNKGLLLKERQGKRGHRSDLSKASTGRKNLSRR